MVIVACGVCRMTPKRSRFAAWFNTNLLFSLLRVGEQRAKATTTDGNSIGRLQLQP